MWQAWILGGVLGQNKEIRAADDHWLAAPTNKHEFGAGYLIAAYFDIQVN